MSSQLQSRRSLVGFLAALPLGLAAFPRRTTASAAATLLEPQPQMRAALRALHAAKTHLEKATPDKGGHRVKALELIGQAIEETEAGIRFDNRH